MKNSIIKLLIISTVIISMPLYVKAEDLKSSINDYRKIKKNLTSTPTPDQSEEQTGVTPEPVTTPKKQQLTKIISILIQIANEQKEQVNSIQCFDQLQKDQLSQIIQTLIGDLMTKASKIDSSNDEKLKTLADDVLSSWSAGQLNYKKNIYTIINSRMQEAESLFDSQIKNLQAQHDSLKSKNKDVSLLQTKIAASQTQLNSIKLANQQIAQKLSSLNKGSDLTASFQDILNIASQSNATFSPLRQSIFDATSEINRLNKDKK